MTPRRVQDRPELPARRRRAEQVELQKEYRQRVYDHLMQLGKMQVDAELMYHNRSSVITVVLGMLAVAFVGLITKGGKVNMAAGMAVAAGGLIISILWLLMEQRNQVYFVARGNVIGEIESRIVSLYREKGFDFPVFWGRVPGDVRVIAKPYQRVSAPLISRGLIPALFCVLWLIFLMQGTSLYVDEPSTAPAKTPAPVSERLPSTKVEPCARLTPHELSTAATLGCGSDRNTPIQSGSANQGVARPASSTVPPGPAASAIGSGPRP